MATDDDVQPFFDRYAAALAAIDLEAIADCYAYPSLAVSRLGRVAIGDQQQVRDFFGPNGQRYRDRGIVRLQIADLRAEYDDDGLWVGTAQLQNLDEQGEIVDVERNAYQLVREDGDWKIAVTTPLDAR